MTREKFIRCLSQALEHHDVSISREILEKFANLNFDEDNSLADWDYDDFYYFASDVAANDHYGYTEEFAFWDAARSLDLNVPEEFDEE